MQENQQLLSPQTKALLTKSNIRSRFSKYKPMIEKAKSYNNEGSLDHIFSHFCYKPLQVEAYIKDGSSSSLERLSTFQSELDCSQQQIIVDQSSWTSKSEIKEKSTTIILETQTNSKKPEYIQQFSRLNSIIPNHHYPNFKIKQEMGNLTLLIKSALKAIHHVFGCALRVGNKSSRINVFPALDKNKLTVNYFLHSGWQKLISDPCISKIKPNEHFKCTLDFNQVLTQLDLLLSKTSRYELAASLTQQIDLNLYLKIRQNLFQVEDKLIQCSNSLYALWNTNEYPDFYYMYLKILKCDHDIDDQDKQLVIRQFRHLWEIHEPLTCSEIGRSIWEKVHKVSQNRNTTI